MDIFNELTAFLITENLQGYAELGIMCLLFGFAFYSLLSLLSYGIIQILRLINI